MKPFQAVAIVCARNEAHHIQSCLRDLISDGLEVLLIDHQSEDGTVDIARSFLGAGLLGIEHLPWQGAFALNDQMRKKQEIIAGLTCDWVLHVDCDEWLTAPWKGETLAGALAKADAQGFNVVNFDEFVFVPWPTEDFTGTDYRRLMRTYYFFQPKYPWFMRAWKRNLGFENISSGGHLVRGEGLRLYPIDFIIRHYICLSLDHACEKFLTRRFSETEVKVGMHGNRLDLSRERLKLPDSSFLLDLPQWDSREFDKSRPTKSHFWDWGDDNAIKA